MRGSTTSLLRSTTTVRGVAKAAWTAATASADVSPPTLTPATLTPSGTVEGIGAVVVVATVVVVVVVVVAVVVAVVVDDVEVVMSAITGPENPPATASPITKRPAASRRFTALAV